MGIYDDPFTNTSSGIINTFPTSVANKNLLTTIPTTRRLEFAKRVKMLNLASGGTVDYGAPPLTATEQKQVESDMMIKKLRQPKKLQKAQEKAQEKAAVIAESVKKGLNRSKLYKEHFAPPPPIVKQTPSGQQHFEPGIFTEKSSLIHPSLLPKPHKPKIGNLTFTKAERYFKPDLFEEEEDYTRPERKKPKK